MSLIADIVGVIGGITATLAWLAILRNERRAKEEVHVLLKPEDQMHFQWGCRVILPLCLKRRDLGRAEILSRIEMLPMRQKGARFSLRALADPAFVQGINEVAEGRTSTLVIPCSADEMEQFDVPWD